MSALRIFAHQSSPPRPIRVNSRLDKYRITRRLGEGGFSTVFAAMDTIEGRSVALKVPDDRYVSNVQTLEDIQREVRIVASLEHPGILQLKNAQFIEDHFVMAFPLGDESLGDRMCRRMSRSLTVEYLYQMVDAVAFAHENRVLHRDIKPENFILFPNQTIRLTDFGLARVETGTFDVSASGTLGYMAPEQAMGKPSYRSDVFSLGLVLYRMLSGELPEYPFEGPMPGYSRLRKGISNELIAFVRKSIDPNPRKRFRDGVAMKNALARIRAPLAGSPTGTARNTEKTRSPRSTGRRIA
ncbi:MAG: serine/threonine-protein kinase [Planctomycetota bacterium]